MKASYEEFDRAQWAARRRVKRRATSTVATRPGDVTVADILEVYGPLAELVADRAGSAEPFVIAVTGSVAVGKSAAAAALAQAFGTDTTRAPVVGRVHRRLPLPQPRAHGARVDGPQGVPRELRPRLAGAVPHRGARRRVGNARTGVLARDLRHRRRRDAGGRTAVGPDPRRPAVPRRPRRLHRLPRRGHVRHRGVVRAALLSSRRRRRVRRLVVLPHLRRLLTRAGRHVRAPGVGLDQPGEPGGAHPPDA